MQNGEGDTDGVAASNGGDEASPRQPPRHTNRGEKFNDLENYNLWVDAGMPVWNDNGNACIPGVVAPAFQTFVLHPFSMHCIMVFLAMLLCIKKGRFDGGDTPFDFCLEREDVRGGNRTSVLPIWEVQMLAPPGVWVGGVSLNITGPALKADHML